MLRIACIALVLIQVAVVRAADQTEHLDEHAFEFAPEKDTYGRTVVVDPIDAAK